MPRRRSRPQPPLPPRDGLGAARVRLPDVHRCRAAHPDGFPAEQLFATVVDFLVHVTGNEGGVWRRVRAGEVRLADGTVVEAETPYRPGSAAYLYRDLPEEVPVPGSLPILLRDDETGLLVVDKPPFLATMPRGRHVAQTALVRLRRELDLPELAPVHRLDRLTSGVLLLTTQVAARSPYQRLVQAGGLAKTYEALAPLREGLDLPCTVRNRLVKPRGSLQTRVVDGEPNAVTRVEMVGAEPFGGRRGGTEEVGGMRVGTEEVGGMRVGRYRLSPTTGHTHQLRVHLAGLGIAILGDPLYPHVREFAASDFSTPLQLLASEVSFTDPVSGEARHIVSGRTLPLAGHPYKPAPAR